jgi:hypothetical protein
VDRDNKHLYELYKRLHDGTTWRAGSGAFFDMNTNNRRPDTWTSADAAGLAILPGLVATTRSSVRTRSATPSGSPCARRTATCSGLARRGLESVGAADGRSPAAEGGKDISGFSPEMQKIFRR